MCGCWGEPVDNEFEKPAEQKVFQPQHAHNFSLAQQPAPHPALEKPLAYQQPTISPPPPAHPMPMQNGSPAPWNSPPSPVNQFGSYTPSASPPLANGSYNGSMFNGSTAYSSTGDTLVRPGSAYMSSYQGTPGPRMSLAPPKAASPPPDEGKMSVSIDFGMPASPAYGSSRIAGGQVQQILNWPGSFETFRKIPTCLLYDEHGQVLAWGLEAKNASPMPGTIRCEWFKLFLEPHALRDESAIDPRLPVLPPGKRAIDLIIDFLSCLWEYAKEQITRDIGAVADLNSADVWLTVPAAWDAKGCDIMREAAIAAGLVQSSRAGDYNWRDRLRIITEPEAAAVHCAELSSLHRLKPSQNFVVVDAGGGTVDLAVYKIIGQLANLEIAEMCTRSGANCGSLFLDLRFRELVKALLAEHPVHLEPASLASFMHSFSETEKLAYAGVSDDQNMFHFTCFNVEDPHDPSVGLIDGQLSIPGTLLRREVFDPVIGEVLQLIENQVQKLDQRIDALLLVGGFAGSEYLKQRVEEQFSSRIKVIARPADADTATLRGAARYGLARRPLVSSVIAPRSYIMKVKLPAEQEDWLKRPAYIKNNDAGVPICDNRYATLGFELLL
ncbi:hypothetical protein H0H81_008436 [Sphagnurus paluster]|uniref:Actin-like ATPase domain-containing protein n=1 Tax=Sphagnurus paluster TaxID=117069 RepID=A0A9P7K5E9_9AGAR|nr:hypothetical protein H0H81_008436 [Sphagnurus paluster]